MEISPINTTNSTNNFKCNVILIPQSNHPYFCPRTLVDTLYRKLSVDQQNKVKNLLDTLMNVAKDKEIIIPSLDTAIIAARGYWKSLQKNGVIHFDESKSVSGLLNKNLEQFVNELIKLAKKYDNSDIEGSILNHSIFVNA